MKDWVDIRKDEKHVTRERAKARDLRSSSWWKNILQKGICHYCGRQVGPDELTMDHVVPVARGGKSTKGNIVPSCKQCNNRKKYYTPAELVLQELEGGDEGRVDAHHTEPEPETDDN